jgi:hypothetical protein
MKYQVVVQRTEHREHTFTVEADSRNEASAKALDAASDHDFNQNAVGHADESVVGIRECPDPDSTVHAPGLKIFSGDGQPAPRQVEEALKHVRTFHPDVVMVTYGLDTRWMFTNKAGEPPDFDRRVDVGILEDAQSSLSRFPAIFQVAEDE